jgi:hypothetical protein
MKHALSSAFRSKEYCPRIKIFVVIDFFYNFYHSSYPENYAITIYFIYYILHCCMYFKLDLLFYMFAIIF